MSSETLAHDVAWEPSGHLSEIGLTALADGEDALLSVPMHAHLDTCEACAARLGEVAMRSAGVAEALSLLGARPPAVAAALSPAVAPAQAAAPRQRTARERRKVPVAAIAAALAVAVLGTLPSMLSLRSEVAQTVSVMHKVLPSLVRLLPQAIERMWSGAPGPLALLTWGLALALVAAGLGIAKKASKRVAVEGGRR
jgi:hypothetical protein